MRPWPRKVEGVGLERLEQSIEGARGIGHSHAEIEGHHDGEWASIAPAGAAEIPRIAALIAGVAHVYPWWRSSSARRLGRYGVELCLELRVTRDALRLGKGVLLAPIPLGLEAGDQLLVATCAHRLGNSVLAAPIRDLRLLDEGGRGSLLRRGRRRGSVRGFVAARAEPGERENQHGCCSESACGHGSRPFSRGSGREKPVAQAPVLPSARVERSASPARAGRR